jgi:hypothetical protein
MPSSAIGKQAVEKSNSSAIADNITILSQRYSLIDDNGENSYSRKIEDMYSRFFDLTMDMIEREKARQRELESLISWSNLCGNIAAIFAHLFLLLGTGLGLVELRRAYTLRQRGFSEALEIQIGLEGAAIKSSMYGFLVFGA